MELNCAGTAGEVAGLAVPEAFTYFVQFETSATSVISNSLTCTMAASTLYHIGSMRWILINSHLFDSEALGEGRIEYGLHFSLGRVITAAFPAFADLLEIRQTLVRPNVPEQECNDAVIQRRCTTLCSRVPGSAGLPFDPVKSNATTMFSSQALAAGPLM